MLAPPDMCFHVTAIYHSDCSYTSRCWNVLGKNWHDDAWYAPN